MQSNNPDVKAERGVRPIVVLAMVVMVGLLVIGGLVLFRRQPQKPPDQTANAGITAPSDAPSSETPSTPRPATAPTASGVAPVKPDTAATPVPPPSKAEASVEDLIKILKDSSQSLSARKQAIAALARNGSSQALGALKEALTSGSSELRSAIAEGLGECSSAECTATLVGLLADPDKAIVKAAIRGLAQQGSPQAVEALTKMLYDPLRSVEVRSAAALGLGDVNQPGVVDTLAQAAVNINDEDIVTDVLNALGGRSFSETQSFFQNYLRSPNVSSDLRVAAIESLAQAQGDPSAFLASLASDPDSDVRASVGWAMSATESSGNAGPQLLSLLQAENDPDVRLRLYEGLGNQADFDLSGALAAIQKEKDPSARVAALDLLAKLVRDKPTPELQAYFDQNATSELKQAALSAKSKDDRMAATIALIRAGATPSAQVALTEVAQQSSDPKVQASARQFLAGAQVPHPK